MNLARTAMLALGLGSLTIMAAALARSAPPAWVPPGIHPLREIWSFDTKG